MSDYRGPSSGSGDAAPDAVPRTGPPTRPTAVLASDAAPTAPAATDDPLSSTPETHATPQPDVVAEPETAPEGEPAAVAPLGIEPVVVRSAIMNADALPTVIAIPEAPSDTPGFVMVEPASSNAVAAAALPVPVVVLDLPIAPPVGAPSGAPPVADSPAPVIEEPVPSTGPLLDPQPAPELPVSPPPLPAPPPPIEAAPIIAASVAAVARPALDIPAPVSPTAPPTSRAVWPRRIRRAALILVGLVVGYAVLVLGLIVAYRWVDPPRSALMIATRLTGQSVVYGPVPITSISSHLQRAVVTSEDARFCTHRGVDWAALYEAMNESRGGSTITMQTAKNLFLWSSRSYVRKAIEIPVALTIDALWPKRRILEVYLNIAEWGPGIFGAEAAAYYHFNKPASRLTAQEAALLAASLPNPIARDAGEPGRITAVLASRLRARMANSDAFVSCLGLRHMPRAAPRTEPKAAPRPTAKPTSKSAPEPKPKPWQTTIEPAFNPWQN